MRTIKVGLCGFTVAMASYPRHYPVVEVQHTFYEPPSDPHLLGWKAKMPPGFEFTIKAWQLITHASTSSTYRKLKRALTPADREGLGGFKDSAIVAEGWRRTVECARALEATAILFQCPASFQPTRQNLSNLRAFFARIERPEGIRLMWEPRGEWPEAKLRKLCGDLQLLHVVDPFKHRAVTQGPTYLRLHGYPGSYDKYTDAQLERLYAGLPADEECYVMFNNIPRVGDSKRFLTMLDDAERVPPIAP